MDFERTGRESICSPYTTLMEAQELSKIALKIKEGFGAFQDDGSNPQTANHFLSTQRWQLPPRI
jgi:hypothetical protein